MSSKPVRSIGCVAFLIMIMAACATPTNNTVPPPTNTQIRETETPRAATNTPIAPTPTSTPTQVKTKTPKPSPSQTSFPTTVEVVNQCPGAPAMTLKIGDWAMVSTDPPIPNKVRSQPGSNSELIGQIQPGENVLVLDGPQCSDGYTWWHVHSLEGVDGWTAEGDASGYWLVDPISAWFQLPEPLKSGGTKLYDLREISISADRSIVDGIIGNYNPLATPLPRPQTDETPEPNDPRYSDFGTASYAAHSFYDIPGNINGYMFVYELEDSLSRYFLNHMSHNDCTQVLRSNLDEAEIVPAYLNPFCGINGAIPLLFIAGVKPIQFDGGEGVRYLIASGNYQTVNQMEYIFQGLSEDGRYYIRVRFNPIIHPYILDARSLIEGFGPLLAWKEGQYEEAQKSYDVFNGRIEDMLNAGVVTLYPSLELYDAMMASIAIK